MWPVCKTVCKKINLLVINPIFLLLSLCILNLGAYADNLQHNHRSQQVLPSQKESFLVLSDIHLNKNTAHQMEISPSKFDKSNDLDEKTFVNFLDILSKQVASEKIEKPKYILILGDIVGHDLTSEKVLENEAEIFSQIKNHFDSIPLLYVFGNNDSPVKNYGPFRTKDAASPYSVAESAGWKNGFLSTGKYCTQQADEFPCIAIENEKHGYAAAYLNKQLKLLAINSVMFSPKRSGISAEDVKHQFAWLEQELQQAEQKNENVILAMHIPPGSNIYDGSVFWLQDEQDQFLKITTKYKSNIAGILTSHTHTEEAKIIRGKQSKNNVAGVIFTPALSTAHGNMPAFKLYHLEKKEKWVLSDYDCYHYYMNDQNSLDLEKLYNFQNYYCNEKQCGSISDGLNSITIDKLKAYFTAGNKNYFSQIKSERDFILEVNE